MYSPRCLEDLRCSLPADLEDIQKASPNYAIGKQDSLAFLNGKTHELLGVVGTEGGALLLKHKLLRGILVQHLHIQYSKTLTSYEHSAEGLITAHFKEGTTAQGAVLVGADGSNSRVRSQLLNGFEATPSQAVR